MKQVGRAPWCRGRGQEIKFSFKEKKGKKSKKKVNNQDTEVGRAPWCRGRGQLDGASSFSPKFAVKPENLNYCNHDADTDADTDAD